PLEPFRSGNFSSLLGNPVTVSGQQIPIFNCDGTPSGQVVRTGQIFDPRSQTNCPNPAFNPAVAPSLTNLPYFPQPFGGNIIPNGLIDSVSAKFLANYPLPNISGTPNAAGVVGNNFVRTPTLTDDADRITTRFDYKINGKNNIFGRYAYGKRDRFVPGFF